MNDGEGIREILQQHLGQGGFHQVLRLQLIDADQENGTVTVKAPFQTVFERGPNSRQWHGGPIAAIVDIAADLAIYAQLGHGVPTANIRVDFIRPAVDTDLIAHGKVIRVGRTLAVADVEVVGQQDKLVATGRGTYVTRR